MLVLQENLTLWQAAGKVIIVSGIYSFDDFLAVRPDFQVRGIGKLVMQDIIEMAEIVGCIQYGTGALQRGKMIWENKDYIIGLDKKLKDLFN